MAVKVVRSKNRSERKDARKLKAINRKTKKIAAMKEV